MKKFKAHLFRISWYMRGGVTMEDLLHIYSQDDLELMNKIIQENIEMSQKSGLTII